MAYINASLVQQIFDIAKGKWKANIQHHRQADDLGRRFDLTEWETFCHSATLSEPPVLFN